MANRAPELMVVAFDGAVPGQILDMIDRGILSAFSRLMKRGIWFDDVRPAFPSITPTCWASFATGARPIDHGAVDQDFHPPDSRDPESLTTAYHGDEVRSERFWETAAGIGKRSLIIQMPASGPRRSESVLQVGGTGCSATGGAIRGRQTVPQRFEVPATVHRYGAISRSRETEIRVDTGGSSPAVVPFSWYTRFTPDGIILACRPGSEGNSVGYGDWSPPISRDLDTENGRFNFVCRAKLMGPEDPILYITPMDDIRNSVEPESYAAMLKQLPEVPAHSGSGVFLTEGAIESYFEIERFNLSWQREVIRRTLDAYDIDIVVTYAVFLDSMNHLYRNLVEGIADTPVDRRRESVARYEEAYRIADSHLASILESCDEETTIVVLSDHGSVGYSEVFRPETVLERAGLLVYEATGEAAYARIDWSKTRAYPVGTCYVRVNLQGREETGIVRASEYDETTSEVIRSLKAPYPSAICNHPVEFAVRRDDAGFIGLGGDRCGDVVYGLTGSRVGGHIGGVHACQVPSARTETGDIRSTLLIAGPRFTPGIRYGHSIHLWDIAPLLCKALGYPLPGDARTSAVNTDRIFV